MPTRDEILDRFIYHAPDERQQQLLREVHQLVMRLAEFMVDELPDSRDRSLALTSLEDTRMRINKAVIFSGGRT
jgi:hypothetical protein